MTDRAPSQGEEPQTYAEELSGVGDQARLALFNETWMVIAVVCVLVGLVGRYESLTLLGVFMLVVSLVARLWNRYVLRRVSYQRQLEPRRAFIGETVEMTLTVENRKPLPVAWMRVQDEWPAYLRIQMDD